MERYNMYRIRGRQKGVGLIEVMVTVLLLATSLLALAALQNRSLQFNQEAYLRSQANLLAYDIIDRIRLTTTPSDFVFMDYNIDFEDTPSGTDQPAVDLTAWRTRVGQLLPGGTGSISCVAATRLCTVAVRWIESSGAQAVEEEESSGTGTDEETAAEEGEGEEGEEEEVEVPGQITFSYQTQV